MDDIRQYPINMKFNKLDLTFYFLLKFQFQFYLTQLLILLNLTFTQLKFQIAITLLQTQLSLKQQQHKIYDSSILFLTTHMINLTRLLKNQIIISFQTLLNGKNNHYKFARKVSVSFVNHVQVSNQTHKVSPDYVKLNSTNNIDLLKQKQENNINLPKKTLAINNLYTFQNLEEDFKTYQKFIQIHNTHSKKPHEKLLTSQIMLINKAIERDQSKLIINFLKINRTNRITNPQSIEKIIEYFQSKWYSMNQQKRLQIVSQLIWHGQFQLYQNYLPKQESVQDKNNKPNLFKKQQKQRSVQMQKCISSQLQRFSNDNQNQKLQFLYCSLLYWKKLPQKILCIQDVKEESLSLNPKLFFLKEYLSKERPLPKFQTNEKHSLTQLSHLQKGVDLFLKTLNYKFTTQVRIDKYLIDFYIQKFNSKSKHTSQTQTVLQVFGNQHFTIREKLRPKDIKKILLLKKNFNVRLIYHQDFNRTKGFRNKIQLLKRMIQEEKGVNWTPQNKGFDSHWQLQSEYNQYK